MSAPLFLISLPRAGSTLLQRLMMMHPNITSKSEPWILLPLIYMLKPDGIIAEYNHRWAQEAVVDFIGGSTNGRKDYERLLSNFMRNTYALHSNADTTYFLDKTPRYYLILNELAELFPEAKFIFLTRSPLQIISSIINTFSENSLKHLHFYHIDLLKGFDKIAEGIEKLHSRSIHVTYESLIADPNKVLKGIFSFIDLNWNQSVSTITGSGLEGKMGDKTGVNQYQHVASHSLDKWKSILQERTRKTYTKHIIQNMSDRTLSAHGYNKNSLLEEIATLPTKTTFRSVTDIHHILRSKFIKFSYLNLYRRRVKNWTKDVVIG